MLTENEAEQLSIVLMQIVAKLNESAAFVKDKDSEVHWDSYRRAVGRAMGEICLELEEPLWQRFPNLKPDYLNGPYKVSPAIFEPKFYEINE